jgi:hypothetical protein
MTDKKPQLTQSMLNMAAGCGIQFQRRYGFRFGVWPQEEIIPPGVAAAIGTAVHKGVERNLNAIIRMRVPIHIEEVKDAVRDSLSAQWCEGVMLQEEEAISPDDTKGKAIDQAIALSQLHYEIVAPKLAPMTIEQPFTVEMVSYPMDLGGKIDIIEHGNSIRDTKTSGKTPEADAARTLQVGCYALSRKVETGILPALATLDFLVKTKVPKYEPRTVVPDDRLVDYTLARFERLVTIIETVKAGKEAFQPAQPEDWRCSAKWCGYHASCKFWSGR